MYAVGYGMGDLNRSKQKTKRGFKNIILFIGNRFKRKQKIDISQLHKRVLIDEIYWYINENDCGNKGLIKNGEAIVTIKDIVDYIYTKL